MGARSVSKKIMSWSKTENYPQTKQYKRFNPGIEPRVQYQVLRVGTPNSVVQNLTKSLLFVYNFSYPFLFSSFDCFYCP